MKFKIALILLLFLVLNLNYVKATTYINLPVYAMDKRSDMIVIGKVLKPVERITRSNTHHIIWLVEVEYYIKGKNKPLFVKVATPERKPYADEGYNVSHPGDYVLLFLRNAEKDIFVRYGISGCVKLEKKEDGRYIVTKLSENIMLASKPEEYQNYIDKSKLYSPGYNKSLLMIYIPFMISLLVYFLVILTRYAKLKRLS